MKRGPGSELNHDNWDKEEEKEERGQFVTADKNIIFQRKVITAKRKPTSNSCDIFKSFKGFSQTSTAPINFSMSTTHEDSIKEKHLNSLKLLNQKFLDYITKSVSENPICVLTPTLDDYFKHLDAIKNKYPISFTNDKSVVNVVNEKKPIINLPKTAPFKLDLNAQSKPNFSLEKKSEETNTFSFGKKTEEAKPSFSFGNKTEESKTSVGFGNKIDENKHFSFGNKAEVVKPSFSFGNKTEEAKPSFSFGNKTEEAKPSFSFGNITEDSQPSFGKIFEDNKPTNTFETTFGENKTKPSSLFGENNIFTTPTSSVFNTTSLFGNGGTTLFKAQENQNTEEDDSYVPPTAEIREVKEEGSVFEMKCKLYYQKEKEWKVRGVGNLFIKPISKGKFQLVIRADNSLATIILNVLITASIPLTTNKNNVSLATKVDFSNNESPTPLLIRVQTEEKAAELLTAMKKEL